MITNNCTQELLDYYSKCCAPREGAGIGEALLIKSSYRATLLAALAAATTENAIKAAWDAALAADALILMGNVRGSYDGGQAQTTQGYGRRLTEFVGMSHTVTVTDPNVVDNWEFHKNIRGSSGWVLMFCTESQIWDTFAPCTVITTMPVQEDYNQQVTKVLSITWTYRELPKPYAKPSHLFDCGQGETALVLTSAGAATPVVRGAAATRPVDIVRTGFTGLVTFSPVAWPQGITLGTQTGGATNQATIQVLVAAGVPTGSYSLVLRGSGGSTSDNVAIPITVS